MKEARLRWQPTSSFVVGWSCTEYDFPHVDTHARIALTGSASFAFSNSIALALEISRCSACKTFIA
jgi:hypothetical protein